MCSGMAISTLYYAPSESMSPVSFSTKDMGFDAPNREPFQGKFTTQYEVTKEGLDHNVYSFENLGRDARLVVPGDNGADYAHYTLL